MYQKPQLVITMLLVLFTVANLAPQALGAETAATGSATGGVGMTTVVTSSVLSAVVACLAAVAIMMAVRFVRSKRAQKSAEKRFSNMQGRLSHATNLGFDSSSASVAGSNLDTDSLDNVDLDV